MTFDPKKISTWSSYSESITDVKIGASICLLETNKVIYEEQEGVYFTDLVFLSQEYFYRDSDKPLGLRWSYDWYKSVDYLVGIDNIVLTSIYDLHITPW